MTSAHKRQLLFWLIAATLAVLLLFFIGRWREQMLERQAGASFLTGDPGNGAWLYDNKGCSSCHPLDGPPRHGAPDLRAAPKEHESFTGLVSAMWNHAPAMWHQINVTGTKYPNLSEQEVADLFAFLYVVRYVNEAGSAEHGRIVFEEKDCLRCHSVGGQGGQSAPDLAYVENADAPVVWTQMMWNHALSMQAKMQSQEVAWPRFEKSEMTDLLAYLRSVNHSPRSLYELFPANVGRGRKLFREKECASCHQPGEGSGPIAPDLSRLPQMPRTVSQMSAVMWNHWPEMSAWLKQRKLPPPVFREKEMADLIAYLYALRYFDEPGHAAAGRQVYLQKRCDTCHGPDGRGTSSGPSLASYKGKFSVVVLATAMWRHGPRMHEHMLEKKIPWPKFEKREVDDLIAYLNTW